MSAEIPADVVLRSPGADDVDAWVRFVAVERARTYAGVVPATFGATELADAPAAAARLAGQLAAPDGARFCLAEADGEIVGAAEAGPAPSWWEVDLGLVPPPAQVELQLLYVRADHRGTGLADRLLTAVLDPGPAYLWLIAGNARAERYYERRGFRSLDERVDAGETWGFAPMHRMVREP